MVSLIGSNVTSCSARQVRRVELAAPLQRHTAAGGSGAKDDEGRRVPHPALFPQPQDGGVVYAENSGAVSIIGSTVTGCSAGGVCTTPRLLLAANKEGKR